VPRIGLGERWTLFREDAVETCNSEWLRHDNGQLRRRQMGHGRERTHMIVVLAVARFLRRQMMRAIDRADDKRRAAYARRIGHPPRRQNRAQEHGAQRKRYGEGSDNGAHNRKFRF